MEQIDRIFTSRLGAAGSFAFDAQISRAFDDMAARSIPFYSELQKTLPSLIRPFVESGDRIYDLGCSTGNSLCSIALELNDLNLELIGVDSSTEMMAQCEAKLKHQGVRNVRLVCSKLEELGFEPCGATLINYTLQFLKPSVRPGLLARISASMKAGGIIVLSEKCKPSSPSNLDLLDSLYHDFKGRNGYSATEIARKQSALQGVLVPYTVPENQRLLEEAGFERIELLFKSYHFSTFIGFKAQAPG